ncbi:hypothetical protein [Desulforhopalus singaporensis]|uniref:Vitamin B12 dependent methionine synthase, activation domain n=1 Tax=Desulforhopalus singaporensis TaxID=91360 RepID=A0A1H0KIC1_9BACT|nr:hypothetical protein [Desulforhopalus singaporensis]SDO55556.1 hypothetical protein SAMN05660330_00510 [Desulforhopalus singaporensis]
MTLSLETEPQSLRELTVNVLFDELAAKIKTGKTRPAILDEARRSLVAIDGCWSPAITYRWVKCRCTPDDGKTVLLPENETPVQLDLGHSTSFTRNSEYALIAAYTAGYEIDLKTQEATDSEQLLFAYMLDLIGLLVLEKVGDTVTAIAEEKAREFGWGVSPFLSPGSVHGWDLIEQVKLCSLLPLDTVNITVRNDAVLTPFKSLSCMICIGRGYKQNRVGTTCQVCSRNNNCEMQQHQ